MADTSPKLRVRPDRPVAPFVREILRRVHAAAREQGIEYFVGGALARDLILLHVFGKDTGRATRDVDLGISIDNWGKLDTLKVTLIQDGSFTIQPKLAHRLIYQPTEDSFPIPLDLLPFGEIENTDGTIAWPPGMEIVMNVAGFSEARASALLVEVAEGLVVPVASLPSLAMLKLIAWRERHLQSQKDATDFLLIARHYTDAGNYHRLYETEAALLQAADFDPEFAGAALLGKDAAAVSSARTQQTVTEILTDSQVKQRLIDQLLRTTLSSGEDAANTRVEQYIDFFLAGFLENGYGDRRQ
jgi:predicted nucleotidyltransferase